VRGEYTFGFDGLSGWSESVDCWSATGTENP